MNKSKLSLLIALITMITMTVMPAVSFASNGDSEGTVIKKEETVYVVTDSTGIQDDVIVSDHLINNRNYKQIKDETNLTDIENVKGDEKFKLNGSSLTWNAGGNDIYYQGRTKAEVPLKMDVSYKLDGEEITGQKLQGKSGELEINIKYTNEAKYEGKSVPIIVMTGLIVTDGSFTDIAIDNGKIVDDGDKQVVIGMAAPNFAETLGVGENELGISDSITITGKAKKFAIKDMMTLATNSVFEDIKTGELDDMDFDSQIDQLNKGAKKLVGGSRELYDGLEELSAKTPGLKNGVNDLNDGSQKLLASIKKLSTGAGNLLTGANGVKTYSDGIAAAVNGDTGLAAGATGVDSGISSAKIGLGTTVTNDQNIISDLTTIKNSCTDPATKEALADIITSLTGNTTAQSGIVSSLGDINTGSTKVKDGLGELKWAVNGTDADHPGLVNTANSVAGGAAQLDTGLTQLTGGASDLASGMSNLNSQTGTLVSGVNKLDGGASQLSSGMQKLYNQGIKKIVDLYNDELKGLSDGLSDMMDAGKGYKSFTILPSNMDGNVKFIYKTVIAE